MKVQTFNLVTNYITEDEKLCLDMKSIIDTSNQTLIVAPQGVGKTTFIEEVLGDKCYVISPTRALANQINSHDIFQNLATTLICGYDKIKENPEEYSYIVFDECHYLVNYCSFAYNQVEHFYKIYDLCNELDIKVIFITATPQILYCLEKVFYTDIDYKIKINAHKQYVDKVYVYDELNQEFLIHELLKYHKQGYMQVGLINDTTKIIIIAEKLKNKGLRVAAISSKNRDSDENAPIFSNLTNNQYIDLDVLLVTSWADVGINFVNENISHIYYECGNSYERGSLTSLMQWIARPRNCIPDLHIVRPKLTEYDIELLRFVSTELEIDIKNLVENLIENKNDSIFHSNLTDVRLRRYQDIVTQMNNNRISSSIGNDRRYFIRYANRFKINTVAILNEIHMLMDRLTLQDIHNFDFYFQYSKLIPVSLVKLGVTVVYEDDFYKICNMFDVMAKTGFEVETQEPIKNWISSCIGEMYNGQISRVLSKICDEIGVTLKYRKSHGIKIYRLEYIDAYNPYDLYSGELSKFIEPDDYIVDIDCDIYEGVEMPFFFEEEIDYKVKDGYTIDSVFDECLQAYRGPFF